MMRHRRIGVLALQETRRNADSEFIDLDRFLFFESLSVNNVGGVALIISPELSHLVKGFTVIEPGRVIALRVGRTTFISAYLPTFDHLLLRDVVLSKISSFLESEANRQKICILGDLNARQRCQISTSKRKLTLARDQLDDFCAENKLCLPQESLQKNKMATFTHKSSTLDYIVLQLKFKSALHNYVTFKGPFRSDHKVLCCSLLFHYQQAPRSEKNITSSSIDLTFVSDIDTRTSFVQSTVFPLDADPVATLTALHSQLLSMPVKSSPPSRVRSFETDLALTLQRMQDALRDSDGDVAADDFLLTSVDDHNQRDVNRLVHQFSLELRAHPRRAWQYVDAIRGRCSAKFPAESHEARMDAFHKHFSLLFAPKPPPEPPPTFTKCHSPIPFRTGPFTMEELSQVLSQAQNGKSPGPDGVMNELLKIPELRDHILKALNHMYAEGVPPQLACATLVPLPKKGDLSKTGNWRGIALLPHITKIFNSLLLHRLRDVIDPCMSPMQNGFRPGRSTAHHAACIRVILDNAAALQSYPVFGCYVDFSKAFDSVSFHSVRSALEAWNVPIELITAVFSVIEQASVRVRVDGKLSLPITVTQGVLQGDTLAPFLFILVVDQLLRSLPPCGLGVTDDLQLRALAYADDIILLAASLEDLQTLFSALERSAASVGLQLNHGRGKTEFFSSLPGPSETLRTAAGGFVPVARDYKYLGVNTLDFEVDLAKRRSKAWGALSAFKHVWKSSLPVKEKRSLFYALIEPIFTYAIWVWPLTLTALNRIESMFSRMLRYALGFPPVFSADHDIHTEDVYGDMPFITTLIVKRRLSFFAHAFREHTRGRLHPLIHTVTWTPPRRFKRKQGGQRLTLQRALLRDAGVDDVSDLLFLFEDRSKCTKRLEQLHAELQAERWNHIRQRRERRTAQRPLGVQ
jgi:hypothetical protein